MKLKYYLRGLGIGIICTAIIMGIALSGNKKETMTDTEIIERARLLGMVMPEDTEDDPLENDEQDSSVDKDLKAETEEKNSENKDNSKTESSEKKDNTQQNKAENSEKDDNKTGKKETDQKPSNQQDKDAAGNAGSESGKTDNNAGQQTPTQEMVQIEIKAGDVSATVSQTLLKAGLISDAEAFNDYLTRKGVDQNLRVGVYQIPVGATQDEIIEILQK